MGSGGSNRKSVSTASFKSIDSFALNQSFQEKTDVGLYINGINHTVNLSKVPNNYGGRNRIYFACPRCRSRVRLLYISDKYLFCRNCARMSYPSQRMGHKEKQCQLLIRLFRRLNVTDKNPCMMTALPPQPEDMCYDTYVQIIRRIDSLQKLLKKAFIKKAVKYLSKHE